MIKIISKFYLLVIFFTLGISCEMHAVEKDIKETMGDPLISVVGPINQATPVVTGQGDELGLVTNWVDSTLKKHLCVQESCPSLGEIGDKSGLLVAVTFGAISSLYNYDLGQDFWASWWNVRGFYKTMTIISVVPLVALSAKLSIDVFRDYTASYRMTPTEKILTNQRFCNRGPCSYVWDCVGVVCGSVLSIGGMYLTYTSFEPSTGNGVWALIVPTYVSITTVGLWSVRKNGGLLYEYLRSCLNSKTPKIKAKNKKRELIVQKITKFKEVISEMDDSQIRELTQKNSNIFNILATQSGGEHTPLISPIVKRTTKQKIMQVVGSALTFAGAWGVKELTVSSMKSIFSNVGSSIGITDPEVINGLSETVGYITWGTLGSLVSYSMYNVTGNIFDYSQNRQTLSSADIGLNIVYAMFSAVSTAPRAQIVLTYVNSPLKYPLAVFNAVGRFALDYWSMKVSGDELKKAKLPCSKTNIKQAMLDFSDELLLLLSKMDKKYIDAMHEYFNLILLPTEFS